MVLGDLRSGMWVGSCEPPTTQREIRPLQLKNAVMLRFTMKIQKDLGIGETPVYNWGSGECESLGQWVTSVRYEGVACSIPTHFLGARKGTLYENDDDDSNSRRDNVSGHRVCGGTTAEQSQRVFQEIRQEQRRKD